MSYSISLGHSNIAETTPAISFTTTALNAPNRPQSKLAVDRSEHSEINEPVSSSFRSAWVQSIRSEIKEGTFETTGRIDGTVERLLDILA